MYREVLTLLTKLKQLRQRYGISQKALALEVGVSQHSINKYESHNIEPDIATRVRVADYFNCSADYLINHNELSPIADLCQVSQLTLKEYSLLNHYRKLNYSQKQNILM